VRCLRLALLVATAVMASGAFAAASQSDLTPWLPDESYAGKAQADARLDLPVHFWGAGMPLAKVFSQVREQTGVEIGFWPAGDMNARVCVTLYLNPERPPTLRALMAQLMWVMDCGFAYARGQEGELTYCLLGTTIGSGAWKQLEARIRAAGDERARTAALLRDQLREKAFERLSDLREAMRLTKDEAIKRYRGVDDLTLLALLDPQRRKVTELLLSLPDEDMRQLRDQNGFVRKWEDWTPEQQAILRDAIRPLGQELLHPRPDEHWDVDVSGGEFGVFRLAASRPDVVEQTVTVQAPGLRLARDPRSEDWDSPTADTALRRALGEEISDEEARRIVLEWRRTRLAPDNRMRFFDNVSRDRRLSEAAIGRLEGSALTLDVEQPYALRQIQELVAAKTGMHIISDCFRQPERVPKLTLDLTYPQGQPQLTPQLTALALLTTSATAHLEERHIWSERPEAMGWEWGDAGDFLRFRSVHRDLWRAAFLPEGICETLNSWVDAALPEDATSGDMVDVALDMRAVGQLARRLTLPQLHWGGRVIYGDPRDKRNAYRRAYAELLFTAMQEPDGWVLIGALGDGQWEALCGAGLKPGVDFPAEWVPADFRADPGTDSRTDLLRLVDPDPEKIEGLAGWREGLGRYRRLELLRNGEVISSQLMPGSVRVKPKETRSLLPPEGPAEEGPGQARAETQEVGADHAAEGGP